MLRLAQQHAQLQTPTSDGTAIDWGDPRESSPARRATEEDMAARKALCRAFSTSAVAEAAPALAQRSFLAKIFSSGSRVNTPLTDELPGVSIPAPIPAPATAPTTKLTKLSNGFTIATENTPVSFSARSLPHPRLMLSQRVEEVCQRSDPRSAAHLQASCSRVAPPRPPLPPAGRHRHPGHLCGQRQRV